MDPSQFADQIARTQERYAERADIRAETEQRVSAGGVLAADSPQRIAKRLARLQIEPALAGAIVSKGAVGRSASEVFSALSPGPPPIDARSAVVLERLIGANDLISVGFLEAGYLAGRAVGRIALRSSSGHHMGYGTGSLVSPRLLLTNHHVLATAADSAASRVEFDYQLGPDGEPLSSVTFTLQPDVFFLTEPQLDYSLVAVAERSGDRELGEFGWNRLIEAEGKVLLGEAVNIIQHPGGELKQLALRENKLIDLLDEFVHYRTDTAPGSSGSPVFNDQWELIALHHSGVPKTDEQGRILALDGSIWERSMGEGQIAWIANEGARVSRIIRHLKAQTLSESQSRLRAQIFELAPPPARGPRQVSGQAEPVSADGAAVWTLPVQIAIRLGTPEPAGKPAKLATTAAPTSTMVTRAPADAELDAVLRELERSRRRPYYDQVRDEEARERYYARVEASADAQALYAELQRLLTETHANQPAYKPSRQLYPWVDLHADGQLRSIYSGKTFDPEEFIRADFEMERRRAEGLRELALREGAIDPDRLLLEHDALEAAFPFNCEHVVPQSWFQKREPMRGDLHHLFACESDCNSFRGNTPYYEFADFEEAIRDACGKREENRFEPTSGKGAVARAVLYFLLRYPRLVESVREEFEPERIAILLDWHETDSVDEYERHRNQAIFDVQGNRNPLIDHPESARRVDFALGLG